MYLFKTILLNQDLSLPHIFFCLVKHIRALENEPLKLLKDR